MFHVIFQSVLLILLTIRLTHSFVSNLFNSTLQKYNVQLYVIIEVCKANKSLMACNYNSDDISKLFIITNYIITHNKNFIHIK